METPAKVKPIPTKMMPLSEDEVKVQKNERRERREKNRKVHLRNQEEYMKHRDELLKTYSGKYIIYSESKVLQVSDSPDELLKCLDKDPTVYLTKVGHEDQKPSPKDILLVSDLYTDGDKTDSKTCFPYHEFEQKEVLESEFFSTSGWCGKRRPYITLLLRSGTGDKTGAIATFLIDTQSPWSFIQPSLIEQIDASDLYGNELGTSLVYCMGMKLICHSVKKEEDPRLNGINLLGTPFIKDCGFTIVPESKKVFHSYSARYHQR